MLYMSMLLWMHESLFIIIQCVHNGYNWIHMIRDQVNTRPSEFALLACYYTVSYTIPIHLCPISVPFHWINVCPNWIIAHTKIFEFLLKQQNRYLSVIIVCWYFSFIRSFICLNFPSKSNSYHNTNLSISFGCWHLSGIPLCPLHFTVYTIAWQRKFELQWVFYIDLCILSG